MRLDNLLVTQPRPRNPFLADAFKRAGVVERTARGIDTIFFEQLRNGRPAPSYARSNETGVVLVLPGGKANLSFARLVAEESQAHRPLGLDDLLLLNHLWLDRRLTTEEAARLIQKPDAEARGRLQRLVETGLAEARGERKGRSWHLAAATYRRLGEKAARVHQRGFEPMQQEQLVLQYVEKHSRITRAETAGLCMLSPDQAYRLLRRLTGECDAPVPVRVPRPAIVRDQEVDLPPILVAVVVKRGSPALVVPRLQDLPEVGGRQDRVRIGGRLSCIAIAH